MTTAITTLGVKVKTTGAEKAKRTITSVVNLANKVKNVRVNVRIRVVGDKKAKSIISSVNNTANKVKNVRVNVQTTGAKEAKTVIANLGREANKVKNVRVNVQATGVKRVKRTIASLSKVKSTRVNVQANTEEAKRKITNLSRTVRSPILKPRVDFKELQQFERLQRFKERIAKVNVQVKGVDRVKKQLNSINKKPVNKKVNIQTKGAANTKKQLNNIAKTADRARSRILSLRTAMLSLASGIGIRGVAKYADNWINLTNQIKAAVGANVDYTRVTKEVFQVSQRTRSDLGATAMLFSRLRHATKDTAVTTGQLLRVVETLNKLTIIGGTNAQEARAGLIQFSQGMASGKLQGDELRSVLENLLGVQWGLVEGFKVLKKEGIVDFEVTRKNFRKLASEGKINATNMIKALLSVTEMTDKAWANISATFTQAMAVLNNAFTMYIGTTNEITGATTLITDGIIYLAENIQDAISVTIKLVTGLITAKVAWVLGTAAVKGYTFATKIYTVATTTATIATLGLGKGLKALAKTLVFVGAAAASVFYGDEVFVWLKKFREEVDKTMESKPFDIKAKGDTTKQFKTMVGILREYRKEMLKVSRVEDEFTQAQDMHKQVMQDLNGLRKANILDQKEYNEMIKSATGIYQEHVDAINNAKLDERMQQIASSMESSITDSVMKMSAGLADFADFAKSILRQVAQEMVRMHISKPLSGAFSSILGDFIGGSVKSAFGGFPTQIIPGSDGVLKSSMAGLERFAGGGFTGSGSRSGGVDGQGGFPAILHPNETVIDHNKGAKMGTVNNINVNYSPQVNALDPRTAQSVIAENAQTVVGIIRQSFARTGQQVNI